jgi:hypothetical protein
MALVECPSCEKKTEQLMNHVYASHNSVPEMSKEKREIAIGCLLGDGCVNRNGVLTLTNTNLGFLEKTQEVMRPWSGSINKIHKSGESTFLNGKKITPTKDCYNLTFHRHPFIKDLRSWYSSGKKEFPSNLSLSPNMVKWWYCGDGSLSWNNYSNAFAVITTHLQKHRIEYLESLFSEVGLEASVHNQHIRFTATETKRFLEYINEPIPGFEYKWENNNYFKYKELKGSNDKELEPLIYEAIELAISNNFSGNKEKVEKRSKEIFDKCKANNLGSGSATDLLCACVVTSLNEHQHSPKMESYMDDIISVFDSNRNIYKVSRKEVLRNI